MIPPDSGLAQEKSHLSPRLSSPHLVGEILRGSGIEVIEFCASAIFGAGSISFELITSLVEKLPVMVFPKWIFKKTQPISVYDALFYLIAALDLQRSFPGIIEIGGKDVVTYQEMMQEYAKARGLKRWMIPVPFLSLNLSSLWLALLTPAQARMGKNLVLSLMSNTVVKNPNYLSLFEHETKEILEPQADHLWRFEKSKRMFGFRFGRYIVKRDRISIPQSAHHVFFIIEALGGKNGWYFLDILWKLRIWADGLIGGPGRSLGKSSPPLKAFDVLDGWQVEKITQDQRLLLKSLMKMPGDAISLTTKNGINLNGHRVVIFDFGHSRGTGFAALRPAPTFGWFGNDIATRISTNTLSEYLYNFDLLKKEGFFSRSFKYSDDTPPKIAEKISDNQDVRFFNQIFAGIWSILKERNDVTADFPYCGPAMSDCLNMEVFNNLQ